MEISPRRSLSLDLDASVVSPAASSYPPTYLNCRTNMYTIQGLKSLPESRVTRPYAMSSSLSMDSGAGNVLAPKRENNFVYNIFNAVTSTIIDRIAKIPGSLMNNINSTLSVTVVPNEGIISPEFFKTLTQSCEQLASERSNESPEIIKANERSPSSWLCDSKPQVGRGAYGDKFESRSHALSARLNPDSHRQIGREIPEKCSESEFDCKFIATERPENNDKNSRVNEQTMQALSSEIVAEEGDAWRPSPSTIDRNETISRVKESCSSRSAPEAAADVPAGKNLAAEPPGCAAGWQTMWRRVMGGVPEGATTSRSSTPDEDSEVPTKKPNLAIYPHAKPRRKTCSVARGRGKGRGKSQLRRSGVSQSRHRKERTKQNIYSNIQDDLETWEESECANDSGNEDLQATRDNEQQQQQQQQQQRSPCRDSWKHCSTLFEKFTFDEVISSPATRKVKQRTRDPSVKCPLRVRYVSESAMDVDDSCGDPCDSARIPGFRPRLVSESSVDSEDSYCIVFESSSESEYTDYEYDSGSDEDEDEDVEEDDRKSTRRVRFDLKPQVFRMVHWDFAYRAARPGPWEQMGRDRGRFHERIRCIERILAPILSPQHRKSVWQDRFDVDG